MEGTVISPEPSLLQAEHAQVPQSLFTGEMFQPSDGLFGPCLNLFPELRTPEVSLYCYI